MMESAAEHHGWEYSLWPFLLCFGILFLIPLAFAFHFVYDKPMYAILSLGIGVPLTTLSVVGWVREVFIELRVRGAEAGFGTGSMPFFILAEAFIFVAFFASYWVLRLKSPEWPPLGTPEFSMATPIIMTVMLVSSSVTIHIAEMRLASNDRGGFTGWLIVTIVLGIIFFILSINEWQHLMHGGFNMGTNLFSTFFFSITGFHASHVLVGLGMFICVLIPLLAGKVSHTFVKSASIYWHFVDLVWFFVLTQIYFW